VWWWTAQSSTSVYYPPLTDNLSAFRDAWFSDRFRQDAVPTLMRFAVGFGMAVMAGISAGVVLGLLVGLHHRLAPLLEYARAIPIPALIPAGIVFFGPGTNMNIALVAWGSLWPILLNTVDGVRSIEPTLSDVARVYGLSRFQRLRFVVLPAALPQIFAGLRVGLAIGLAVLIVAEMFAGTHGVGHFILESQLTFHIPGMWAGIWLLALFGLGVNAIYVLIEHRVLAWHRGWRAAAQEQE
jgi:sulfonate transport system permease protein